MDEFEPLSREEIERRFAILDRVTAAETELREHRVEVRMPGGRALARIVARRVPAPGDNALFVTAAGDVLFHDARRGLLAVLDDPAVDLPVLTGERDAAELVRRLRAWFALRPEGG